MFTVAEYDINTFAECGYGSIRVKVVGYWSRDAITIHASRSSGEWDVNVSHSTGGRDTNEVEDNLIAESNFGHALIAAAAEGSKIRAAIDVLEQSYRQHRQQLKEQHDKEQTEREQAVANDTLVGEEAAKAMINQLKNHHTVASVVVRRRGSEYNTTYYAAKTMNGKTYFTHQGSRVSAKEVEAQVARAATATVLLA